MSAEFTIYRRDPNASYELGKAKVHGKSTNTFAGIIAAFKLHPSPGWAAMWSIMGTSNYSVFRLTRFTEEQLADILYRACAGIDTMEEATVVATDLLGWAGNSDLVMSPEEGPVGFPQDGKYPATGSIWMAMNG